MTRLVHTGDVHLDASFAALGVPARLGNRRRQSLRDVFHSIVQRARDWPADALLVAGDLFDHEHVTRDTTAFLRNEFAALHPVPVVIAPGNHDPFTADSPYAADPWPENVFVFTKPSWTSFSFQDGALVVHGFAFDGFDISSNPFGTLHIPPDGAVHVAVAHGTERKHQPPDGKTFAPFDAADAAAPGLVYLALGHFHEVTRVDSGLPTCMYYSGAPEGHDFSETGPHYYLEVEIEGGRTQVRRIPSAQVLYAVHTLDCAGFSTVQEIVEAIRASARDASLPQVARIVLQGFCAAPVRAQIPTIPDVLAEEFEYLDLVDNTRPQEEYEDLARENTTLGMFLRRINAEIQDAPDAARRRMLERAREVGAAAYAGEAWAVRGLETDGGGQ